MRLYLNPEERETKKLQFELERNKGFCPGVERETVELLENAKEYKCICKEFHEQIERKEAGMCRCGLWGVSFDDEKND